MEKVINLGDKLEEGNGQCWEGPKDRKPSDIFQEKNRLAQKTLKGLCWLK